MKLSKVHKLILHSLGQFYQSINQPLTEKPLRIRTSKIAFIELLLDSGIIVKQKRAVYKNLESLEKRKLIRYERRMIKFTENGLKQLIKVDKEIRPFVDVENYFKTAKPKRMLQTVMGL